MIPVLKLFGQRDDYISPLNDPFNKSSVRAIHLHVIQQAWGNDGYRCSGSVEFKTGDTEGKQSFEANSFDALAAKVKAFLEHL